MPEKVVQHRSKDWPLALFRWPLFTLFFAFAYLLSPAETSPSRLYNLLVLAVAYNVIATALAAFNMFPKYLPVITTGLDTLFVAALISASGRNESPLLLFSLIPVLTAALRFQWKGGLAVGAAVAGFWAYLMLPSFPAASSPRYAAEVSVRFLLLLCVTVVAALLGRAEHERALRREEEADEQFRLASEQVKAIYELTGNLSATLNYERVLESVLDIGIMGLKEIDPQMDRPAGMVLLFKDAEEGRKLYIAAYRNLTDKEAEQLLPGGRGLLGRVMNTVEPLVSDSPARDVELRVLPSLHEYRSTAVIPLRAGFELYGAALFASRRLNAYRRDQLAFLSTLCNQATIALQNAQLYQQLQAEKDRIIGSEEEVRRWLARELHDGPTQTLSALAMRLNYTRLLLEKEPEKALEELVDLEKMARRATKEIRTTLFKLRPLALETQGLRGALEQYVVRLQETGGTPVQLDIEEPDERLEPNVEATVFSIIEEAVTNARKHANASSINVRLAPYGDFLMATVHDNGKGFDVKAVEANYDQRGSMGMINMKERAELIGGRLEIQSQPGHGTTVTLAVPLKSAP